MQATHYQPSFDGHAAHIAIEPMNGPVAAGRPVAIVPIAGKAPTDAESNLSISERLRTEAAVSEELDPTNSSVAVMREAADLIDRLWAARDVEALNAHSSAADLLAAPKGEPS